MRSVIRTSLGFAAASALAVGLAGCAQPTTTPGTTQGTSPSADTLSIVTTTTQLEDFAHNLTAGTNIQVTSLFAAGASVHTFEPTAKDLELLRNADLVVFSGMGLEPWLDDTLNSAGFTGLRIDASSGIEPKGSDDDEHEDADGHEHEEPTTPGDSTSHDHDHGDDHGDATDGDTAGEAAAQPQADGTHAAPIANILPGNPRVGQPLPRHDGHDHTTGNPHIWTSPANAQIMVHNLETGLMSVDEPEAAKISENAAAYTAKLTELDTWIRDNMQRVPAAERLIAIDHDALTYYNDAYDITFVGSVMPSWDDNAEPSVAEVNALIEKIKQSHVPAVFAESQIDPKTAEAIAKQAGVKVYSGEGALYTDTLGEKGSEGETYLKATIHNTRLILESWGATATEPPADLSN